MGDAARLVHVCCADAGLESTLPIRRTMIMPAKRMRQTRRAPFRRCDPSADIAPQPWVPQPWKTAKFPGSLRSRCWSLSAPGVVTKARRRGGSGPRGAPTGSKSRAAARRHDRSTPLLPMTPSAPPTTASQRPRWIGRRAKAVQLLKMRMVSLVVRRYPEQPTTRETGNTRANSRRPRESVDMYAL